MTVWWKIGAAAPQMIISTLLVIGFIGPALPAVLQVVLFYGGIAVAVMLCAGIGENLAIRILFAARSMTEAESAAMAPAIATLQQATRGHPSLDLLVTGKLRAPYATGRGRHTVVIAETLPAAIASGTLKNSEAAALLTHADSTTRAGLAKRDPALWFWTTPARLVLAVFARRPLRNPLLVLAWKTRWIVATVAIYQSATTGPPLIGMVAAVIVATMLAMTYTTPWCAHRWEQHVNAVGDQAVRDAGLGPTLAAYLDRTAPGTDEALRRIHRLTPTTTNGTSPTGGSVPNRQVAR